MPAGSADRPAQEPAPRERYGPLSLLRTRKDDGRALIVYERADGAAHDDADSAGAGAEADAGETATERPSAGERA